MRVEVGRQAADFAQLARAEQRNVDDGRRAWRRSARCEKTALKWVVAIGLPSATRLSFPTDLMIVAAIALTAFSDSKLSSLISFSGEIC